MIYLENTHTGELKVFSSQNEVNDFIESLPYELQDDWTTT